MSQFSRFAAVTTLSLALISPAGAMAHTVAQNQTACPTNSTWTGTECACNEGFTSVGGTRCVSATAVCGANARLEGNRCACNSGFLSFKDECLSPSEFCAKTGAAFDAAAGACVCPAQTARNIRTGNCESLPGALLRARLLQRVDVLASVATSDIQPAAATVFGFAMQDFATEFRGVDDGELVRRTIQTSNEIFGERTIAPELFLSAEPRLEVLRIDERRTEIPPMMASQLALIAQPPRATTDLRLIEIQRQIDVGLLTLTQQTSALDTLRIQQVDVLRALPVPGTPPRIKEEATVILREIAAVGTAITETKETLTALEPQKVEAITRELPVTAPKPPMTITTGIATPTPLKLISPPIVTAIPSIKLPAISPTLKGLLPLK